MTIDHEDHPARIWRIDFGYPPVSDCLAKLSVRSSKRRDQLEAIHHTIAKAKCASRGDIYDWSFTKLGVVSSNVIAHDWIDPAR